MKFTITSLLVICCYVAVGTLVTVSAARHHVATHSRHISTSISSSVPTSSSFIEYNFASGPTTPVCQLGNSSVLIQNVSSGVCTAQSPFSSYQSFCDPTGSYYVTYSDAVCSTDQMTSITKTDLGCTEGGGLLYLCQNSELGPALPFTWPPSNWIVTTYCSGYKQTTCSAEPSENILCTHNSVPANQCIPNENGEGAYLNFCTEDSEWIGTASYASDDCSDEVASIINLLPTACNMTFSGTQCVGSPVPLSSYPSAGIFNSGDFPSTEDCILSPTSMITYLQPNECFDSEIVNCAVSGEISFTYYTFGSNCAANSSIRSFGPVATNECTENDMIYFCNGQPFSQPPRLSHPSSHAGHQHSRVH